MDESKFNTDDLATDVKEWCTAMETKKEGIDNIGSMYSAELASALTGLAQSPLTKGCNTQKLVRAEGG